MEEKSTSNRDKFVKIESETRTDLTQLVERLEATEKKSGLELSALSAILDNGKLKVCGEVMFSKPLATSGYEVSVAVYDDLARVVDVEDHWIGGLNPIFSAFAVVVKCTRLKIDKISKIKVYVTEWRKNLR